MLHRWVAIVLCLTAPGCAIVQIGATNPIPGLSTVAVAPFFNLSPEPVVDGRRFALAYYAELQKVPGFQVMPVGVVEQAIHDYGLEMNDPDDVLKLARLLNVDAVVVGAVTDYDPYYPPRIGLQISWYSDKPWTFYPGIPVDPDARKRWDESRESSIPLIGSWFGDSDECTDCPPLEATALARTRPVGSPPTAAPFGSTTGRASVSLASAEINGSDASRRTDADQAVTSIPTETGDLAADRVAKVPPGPEDFDLTMPPPITQPPAGAASLTTAYFDPTEPLMSYTRMFDGADAELVARLRDYVELSGDLRSGGWEAYLHRSEDFVRFASHLMIVEMLTLHGGEAQRRFVFKLRKYK